MTWSSAALLFCRNDVKRYPISRSKNQQFLGLAPKHFGGSQIAKAHLAAILL
jgi:hypothetical protein